MQPAIPSYLIPQDGKVSVTLLGDIEVTYHFEKASNYIPGNYEISNMIFTYKNGCVENTSLPFVAGRMADDIREHRITRIEVEIV